MRLFRGFSSLPDFGGAIAAVGSFDGLHSGHNVMIDRLRSLAHEEGGQSVLLTFEPHPRIVLGRAEGLQLLTTLDEKVVLAEQLGIDNMVVIPFDTAFSALSYSDFVEQYLVDKVRIRAMLVGYNHRFGRDHEGNYELCQALAAKHNFRLEQLSEWRDDDEKVSSTVLRRLIASGDMARAAVMLSHPYIIMGSAVAGCVEVDEPWKLLPCSGRYIAIVNGIQGCIEIDNRTIRCATTYNGEVRIDILDSIS